MCGPCALVCEDLEFSEFPCVGSVLWRVRTLSFQSSPRCGLCVVVCEDFEFLKFTCMWALCCGTSRFCPSIGEIDFPKKSPYRDFHSVLERLFFGVKISIGIFPCAALCSNFLWPPVKGTVSPYGFENASPWGGYTVLTQGFQHEHDNRIR